MSNKTTMYRIQMTARRTAFGAELVNQMTQLSMNQKELALASGIPRDQISRYCNAEAFPGRRNQERIAKALGCERTDLLKTWNRERLKEEYISLRGARDNRVSIELKQVVSQQQALEIMQILGTEGAAA